MKRPILTLVLLALAVGGPCTAMAQSGPSSLFGVWRNPADTVHVEIRSCGGSACGSVVWATSQAQAAARRGSGHELIGQQLLRDLKQTSAAKWRAKVFVPDLDVNLTGVAELLDSDRLRIKGCLLAGLVCRSQTWSRIPAPE